MGRVLLSFSLSASEKFDKETTSFTTTREPPTFKYLLRIDTYEMHAKDCGDEAYIEVQIGGNVKR